jgi:hypothetical protein
VPRGKFLKKWACVAIGFVLILLLCGAEAVTPLENFVNADVSPPLNSTSLKGVVDGLTASTSPEDQVDSDGDGLYDKVEIVIGTDLNNTDSDFDQLTDFYEVQNGLDPLNPDSNNDGLPDYYEVTNVTSFDVDGDNVTNAWDFDNDGDGVNDGVDLSPFAKSIVSNSFHLDVETNGLPTYITFQVRPQQSEYLKLLNQYWNWPLDDKGSMKDLDNSTDDVHLIPMLNLTANVVPDQSKVIDYGITTTSNSAYVPLYAVGEYGTVVAFGGKMIYPLGPPLSLSMDVGLIWRVIGKSDEKAVALKAQNQMYVSISSDGRVVASGSGISNAEKLLVVDLGENNVAYEASNGLYLSVADNGVVFANATEIGDRETFALSNNGGNRTALKAYNGKYLANATDGTLVANSTATKWSSQYKRYLSVADLELINVGVISESVTLATYKEPFMLTGLTIEENYGSQVGLFFSHDRNETIAANLLLSYDFLRNSTTTLSEMADILASYDSQVFSLMDSFLHKDEAFMSLTNEAMPSVLSMLQAGAGSQILPVITSVEDHFTSLDLSHMTPTSYIMGASCNANLTGEPVVTSKTLKMNLYNTTTCAALEIEDVMAEVQRWEPNENASAQLMSMMTAWNIGEQLVTKVGADETKFDFFKDYLEIFNKVKEDGLYAFEALRRGPMRGYEAYRLIAEAHAKWIASGGYIGGKTFRSMFKAWKTNFKNVGNSKTARLLAFKRISQTLEVVGVLVDIGIAIYSVFSLLDSGLSPMGLNTALMHELMTFVYAMVLTMIGAIPVVGWLISLGIALSDVFGQWSEKLFSAILAAMTKVTATVTPSIEFASEPSLTITDKDDNGLDVGDRIEYTARVIGNLTSSDSKLLSYSEMYPYYTIANPAGTNSTVGYPYLTEWVFRARDLGQKGNDIHLWLPIPPRSTWSFTSGTGWRAQEYSVGGWIEPGIGMPNFPVTLQFQTTYELWYRWKHFVFLVFYAFWCKHLDWEKGIKSLGSQTFYFDVLPGNLSDFVKWKSITPLDRDFDGLKDTEEKNASNPLLWDTDGDGLNDKYELDIGTNPKLFDTDNDELNDRLEQVYGTNATDPDTDGDGLSDYTEIAGWVSIFTYNGQLFALHVTSNPLLPDTDSDGLTDNLEYSSRLNPKSQDTDGDGIIDQERTPPDETMIDCDGDGLTDAAEKAGWNIIVTNTTGTYTIKVTSDPYSNDTDFDELTDFQEYNLLSNPMVPDTDGDGVSDLLEFQSGINVTSWDTDGDGLADGEELTFGCSPKTSDTDGDGLLDLDEILLGSNPLSNDTDSDGLGDLQEILFGSDVTKPDSDDDFLFDAQEFSLGTNPVSNDSDNDLLLDGYEVMFGTNPLNNDTDSDEVTDYREIELGIFPWSNDTDLDGLLDGMELKLGTAPWNNDTDFDGLNDFDDPDSYIPNVKQVVLAFDSDSEPTEFINNLGLYTNVTVVPAEELLTSYSSAPYIVLIGRPNNESGTVGNIIQGLLQDYDENPTNETSDTRFAVRYGVWSSKQTVLILSEPYFADHFRALSILKNKNVTILPDSVIVNYPVLVAANSDYSHDYSIYFMTDDLDMVRATDAVIGVGLEQPVNPSVQVTRYNASTTPHSLTQQLGLSAYEKAVGKYLEVKVSENVQNSTNGIITGALIQLYYTTADLDRTGDGDADDLEDFDENTLALYYFNESSGMWTKLTTNLSWVMAVGVNTTDVEIYGKSYAGYVWAYVSHFTLYGIAGRVLFNRPPDVSGAYPSKEYLWPPNHKFVNVTIEGVTDPDGDQVTIRILNITSDEPTASTHWFCEHHHFHCHHHCHFQHNCTAYYAPDAYGIGTDTAHLRAERLGNGNGRVYVITFVASDGRGGETVGSVKVYVPHDRRGGTWHCIDDGQNYDATEINWAEPYCGQWSCDGD